MYQLKAGIKAQAIETLAHKIRYGYTTPFGVEFTETEIHVFAAGKDGKNVQQSFPIPENETKWIVWNGAFFKCITHKELHNEYLYREGGLLF